MSQPNQEEKLSPLGELVLDKTEKYLEKKVTELSEELKKKDISVQERQRLEGEIAQAQQKINQIRKKKILAAAGKQSETKVEKEIQESTASLTHWSEQFKWLQEILIVYTYFTFFIYFKGQTPGKRIFGLKVVKQRGGKISLWEAFERTHGYAYSASLLLVGFLQVLWDKHSLTMHDKIAGTKVVSLRKAQRKSRKKEGPGKKGSNKKKEKQTEKKPFGEGKKRELIPGKKAEVKSLFAWPWFFSSTPGIAGGAPEDNQ